MKYIKQYTLLCLIDEWMVEWLKHNCKVFVLRVRSYNSHTDGHAIMSKRSSLTTVTYGATEWRMFLL